MLVMLLHCSQLASVTLEEPPSQLLETSPASGGVDRGRTFSAHYLGSAGVPEEELVPGHCVRVVHACINQLTASQDSGKHNVSEALSTHSSSLEGAMKLKFVPFRSS